MCETIKKTLIFYHNDPDGIVSGAIAYKYRTLGFNQWPGREWVECIPVGYDQFRNRDWSQLNEVIFVDFTPPSKVLKEIIAEGAKLVWIDHHASAMERNPEMWDSDIEGIRRIDRAACVLTWDYFTDGKRPIPWCVQLTEDMDIWKWEHTGTAEFIEYFFAYIESPTYSVLNDWLNGISLQEQQRIIDIGHHMLASKLGRIKKAFKDGSDITFHGHKCRVINTNVDISMVGEYVYKDMGYDVALIWSWKDGMFFCSLRSDNKRPDAPNVRALAEMYGGGGHYNSAGFKVSDLAELKEIIGG